MAIKASELINEWIKQGALDHDIAAVSIVLVTTDGTFTTVTNLTQDINSKLLVEVAANLAEDIGEGDAE